MAESKIIKWLENEYPHGTDLIYIDYNDRFEDANQLEDVLKGKDEDQPHWYGESQWESIKQIKDNYEEATKTELTEEESDDARYWLEEHDTSDPIKGLMRNTGKQLFFIETPDEYIQGDKKNMRQLIKKYSRHEAQKKEIETACNESFYGAPVSFYFYADPTQVWEAINANKKYIEVQEAYFSTIDRVQGSNWLGDKAVFYLTIPTVEFVENVYLDKAKHGYSWNEIAGQTGYDEATVISTDIKHRDCRLLKSATSPEMIREKKLADNWKATKQCSFGDMKMSRHDDKPYINDFPCGNKCTKCGTFWID